MTDPDALPKIGLRDLIVRSFRLLGAHFAFLFPLAFAPALALAGLGFVLTPQDVADPAALNPFLSTAGAVAFAASILVNFVVSGVMCLAAVDALLGKRHTPGEYLRQTLRHLGPLIGLGLLLSIATALGTLLFIVPAFYLFGRYLPWTPAVVFENAGWSGLGRARDLTRGYRWPLAAASLGIALVTIALILLLSPLLAVANGAALFATLVEGLVSGFFYALSAVFTALVYLRLREIKEGATAADIAASFD